MQKPIEESENIRKRFELPSDACVCGHSADVHYTQDLEMSEKMPCWDGDTNGDLCRCEDYIDSGNGDIYE